MNGGICPENRKNSDFPDKPVLMGSKFDPGEGGFGLTPGRG